MPDPIRFDGRTAIVTGAGGGLGRAHALELARRGAAVVVNDLGGAVDGSGGSSAAAEAVVREIEEAGGRAMANGASVTDDTGVARMVDETLGAFGRIDILIANAGILRDRSFAKMTLGDFEAVVDVHLLGAFKPIKAVWETMRGQGYGRIVVTTSSSGLYGNFGQANYGAAKLGAVGLMNTLRIEGAKHDIRINALAPVAATRMTEGLIPGEITARITPETISPGVMTLLDEEAPNGVILSAGGGVFSLARIYETEGLALQGEALTAENVRAGWAQVADPAGHEAYATGAGQLQKVLRRLSES